MKVRWLTWFETFTIPLLVACGSPPEPAAIQLADRFSSARFDNAVTAEEQPGRTEWGFDGEESSGSPTRGWTALHGISRLAVRDGKLTGSCPYWRLPVRKIPIRATLFTPSRSGFVCRMAPALV